MCTQNDNRTTENDEPPSGNRVVRGERRNEDGRILESHQSAKTAPTGGTIGARNHQRSGSLTTTGIRTSGSFADRRPWDDQGPLLDNDRFLLRNHKPVRIRIPWPIAIAAFALGLSIGCGFFNAGAPECLQAAEEARLATDRLRNLGGLNVTDKAALDQVLLQSSIDDLCNNGLEDASVRRWSLSWPKIDSWAGALIAASIFPFLFAGLSALAKYIWQHVAIKHDISALAYLGKAGMTRNASDRHPPGRVPYPPDYKNCPIYPDNPRYYETDGTILVDNNPHDVIGFVVGAPKWIEDPPEGDDIGFYAELIINWNRAESFREWSRRGYGIQLAMLTDGENADLSRPDNRYLAISPFSEDRKRIVDATIKFLEFRTFRCRPYKKYGFRSADDLHNRQLSWQVSVSRRIAQRLSTIYHWIRPPD